ncbi:MAG: histidine phosphatase family protein [Pedobacter sp.]|nr:histidine phosphatase family protein [Chitinophagaceae bacterium]
MKQLIIIRHAKSSWDFSILNDFDRPLNDRGHRDAPAMAKRLFDKKIDIDAFISSTAKRAFTTATYFAEAYHQKEKNIVALAELYHADASIFYDIIDKIDNNLNTAAIFSHNPGITDFANTLTATKVDNMPTCAVFAITIDCKKWQDFKTSKKTFWFFDYPKNI